MIRGTGAWTRGGVHARRAAGSAAMGPTYVAAAMTTSGVTT